MRIATSSICNLIQSDVETRGQQATACFFFILIVKSDIKIFVSSTDKTMAVIFLVCRDRRPRLSGYANGHRYATTCNLNHSRRCILNQYDIGQSRTPVPTIERGYSIEILAFTVIFLNAHKYRSPPHVRLLPKSATYSSLLLREKVATERSLRSAG